MKQENIEYLKEHYDMEVLDDVLFKDDYHLRFFLDAEEEDPIIRLISGDPQALAIPFERPFSVNEIWPYVEEDNALAEIEGRQTFKRGFMQKLRNIRRDELLYLPLKRGDSPLWLSIAFQCVKSSGESRLLFGTIIATSETTPQYIEHYQKTYQDPLTNLFTRETLKKHIEASKETEDAYGLYIDLDAFKTFNDSFGHQAGDMLLKKIAEHFIAHWEYNVLYYRVGGDEFFVYIYNFTEDEMYERAEKIIEDIRGVAIDFKDFDMSASVGVASVPGRDYYELLDVSDKAMYASKEKGGASVTLYKEGAFF